MSVGRTAAEAEAEPRYGWVVVWAVFTALAVIFGVSYSFAAFFESFTAEFQASRAEVSLVFGLSAFFFKADDPRHAGLLELERDLATPVEPSPEGQYGGAAMQVYDLIGVVCLILGVVLAACTFLPATLVAPAKINLIGGSMLILLGLGLRRLASRASRAAAK